MPRVPIARRAFKLQSWQPIEQDTQGGLHFEAGERSSDAVMDAGAEADMWIRASQGYEVGCRGEFGFVAVGRGEEESDLVAFFQRDALVFEVLESIALEHVQWGVEAEHFLAAAGRIGEEVCDFSVAQQRLHAIAQRVHGGFVTGVEQKDRGRDEFVFGQGGAVLISGGEKLREKILSGGSAAFGKESAHVAAESDGRRDGAVFHGAIPAGLIHGDHIMGPCEDLRGHVIGHAKEAGNDHDGDRFGEGSYEIGRSLPGEAVDQLVRQSFDVWLEQLDLAREKGGVDEPAEAGVHRGFDFEQ